METQQGNARSADTASSRTSSFLARPVVWIALVAIAAGVFLAARYPKAHDRKIADKLVWAGVEHQKSGRLDAAEALYKQALVLNPDSALAYYDLGCVAKDRRDPEVAEFWFLEALRRDPSSPPAQTDLATVQAQIAATNDIEHAGLMKAGLQAFFDDHDHDRAVAIFRAVLAKNPEHYGATFQLARALDATGHAEEAQPLWKKTLQLAEALQDEQTAELARAQIK